MLSHEPLSSHSVRTCTASNSLHFIAKKKLLKNKVFCFVLFFQKKSEITEGHPEAMTRLSGLIQRH